MVFLDMTQCSLVDRNQRSERTCRHPYSLTEMEAASSPKFTYTTLHGIISQETVIYAYIYIYIYILTTIRTSITRIMVHFAKSAHVMRRLHSSVSTCIPTFPIWRYSSHSDVLHLNLKVWHKFNFGAISSLSCLLYMKLNSKFYYFCKKWLSTQIILNYLYVAHYDLQCLSEQFVYLYIILNEEKYLCICGVK